MAASRLDAVPDVLRAIGQARLYIETATSLPTRLLELVLLRVAQIHRSAYCIEEHSRRLKALGMHDEDLGNLLDGRPPVLCVDADEAAAIAWNGCRTGREASQ